MGSRPCPRSSPAAKAVYRREEFLGCCSGGESSAPGRFAGFPCTPTGKQTQTNTNEVNGMVQPPSVSVIPLSNVPVNLLCANVPNFSHSILLHCLECHPRFHHTPVQPLLWNTEHYRCQALSVTLADILSYKPQLWQAWKNICSVRYTDSRAAPKDYVAAIADAPTISWTDATILGWHWCFTHPKRCIKIPEIPFETLQCKMFF